LPDELFTRGAYWYTKGVHWIAFISWCAGAVVFWLGRYLQIGGAIPSFLISAIIYLIFTKGFREKEPSLKKEV